MDDHLALFSRPEFSALNVGEGQRWERVDYSVDGRLVGTVAGVVSAEGFDSGWSASFGGPDLVRDPDTVANVVGLVDALKIRAKAKGWPMVRVRCRPTFYSRNEEAVQFALLNAGFEVEACDLNYHIDLAGFEKAEDYVKSLKREARKALSHALDEPFVFAEDKDWIAGYMVLDANRRRKGRSLALSEAYVLRIRDTFGEKVHMLTLEWDDLPCAAALVYEILPRRWLVVYWGDAFHDLPRSPMNLLAYRVVEWAIERGALSLDLGRSSKDGVADGGLIQFKQSVGAQPSLRLDLVWRP